jgi:hypothetical protein
MSRGTDSQPPEGTHCEGGRVDAGVQLTVYEDQLRHEQIHKLPGIEKRT